MGITLIEVKKPALFVGTPINFATATTAGELIVVAYTGGATGTNDPVITDNLGQTYTKIWATYSIRGHDTYSLWYVQNSAAGVNQIVITSFGSGDLAQYAGVTAAHYTGVAAVALDQNANVTAAQASPFTSSSVTTLQANELLIGIDFNYNTYAQLATGSWVLEDLNQQSNGGASVGFYDQIVSVIGAYALTGTSSSPGTDDYPGIATFKAAASGVTQRWWWNGWGAGT